MHYPPHAWLDLNGIAQGSLTHRQKLILHEYTGKGGLGNSQWEYCLELVLGRALTLAYLGLPTPINAPAWPQSLRESLA